MNADANLSGNFQFVCRQMGNRRIKILNYRKEKQPGLLERLTEYAGSDAYPFHMPGHKRREIPDGIPGGFPDPYGIDITEIDGFDNLHHAEGILKEAQQRAADLAGALHGRVLRGVEKAVLHRNTVRLKIAPAVFADDKQLGIRMVGEQLFRLADGVLVVRTGKSLVRRDDQTGKRAVWR